MSGPEPTAREHDRAARQDDPTDPDTRSGEQQSEEERREGQQQVRILISYCPTGFIFGHNIFFLVKNSQYNDS